MNTDIKGQLQFYQEFDVHEWSLGKLWPDGAQ